MPLIKVWVGKVGGWILCQKTVLKSLFNLISHLLYACSVVRLFSSWNLKISNYVQSAIWYGILYMLAYLLAAYIYQMTRLHKSTIIKTLNGNFYTPVWAEPFYTLGHKSLGQLVSKDVKNIRCSENCSEEIIFSNLV